MYTNWFVDLYNVSSSFRKIVETLKLVFVSLWAVIKGVALAIGQVVQSAARNGYGFLRWEMEVIFWATCRRFQKGWNGIALDMEDALVNGWENFSDKVNNPTTMKKLTASLLPYR